VKQKVDIVVANEVRHGVLVEWPQRLMPGGRAIVDGTLVTLKSVYVVPSYKSPITGEMTSYAPPSTTVA
jgi:hypothetical protein